MRKINQLKMIKTLLIVLAVALISACNEQEEDQTGDASGFVLPPAASMTMEFEAMPKSQNGLSAEIATDSSELLKSSSYFNFAAFQVGGWSTLLRIHMTIPVAAFVESFRHRPVRQPDGSWVWSYSLTIGGLLHTAQLYGRIEDEQVFWDMYISKEGEYTRFNWFSGVSEIGAGSGYWVMNKNPQEPVALLRIDWNWHRASNTGDVLYTNIEPGGAENGGYIHYGNNQPEPYQAFFDVYNRGQDNLIEVELNTHTHEGRVRNLQHFGNEDWHYWDSNLQDTVAPNAP